MGRPQGGDLGVVHLPRRLPWRVAGSRRGGLEVSSLSDTLLVRTGMALGSDFLCFSSDLDFVVFPI
jgi:hypothetical protein